MTQPKLTQDQICAERNSLFNERQSIAMIAAHKFDKSVRFPRMNELKKMCGEIGHKEGRGRTNIYGDYFKRCIFCEASMEDNGE